MQNMHYKVITKYTASCKTRVDVVPDRGWEWYNLVQIFKSLQSFKLIGTTILKVSSNGEIVREIKRI